MRTRLFVVGAIADATRKGQFPEAENGKWGWGGGQLLEEYSCSACSRAQQWAAAVFANAQRVGCAHLMFGSLFSFF